MCNAHLLCVIVRAVVRCSALVLLALTLTLWPRSASAATLTVDGTTCSLPDAIAAANLDVAAGGCGAGSGADTLLLTAPTYSLAIGPYDHEGETATPSVTSKIVIRGGVGGAIIERSPTELADVYRLFHVGESGDLTLQNVVVRNFAMSVYESGGAIFNRGVLTIVDSDFISNSAPSFRGVSGGLGGGLVNYGTATLSSCSFAGNYAYDGGGIANLGTATLTNCDFTGNMAKSGGGIENRGTITLTHTVVISNTAEYHGGGLLNDYGTATLINSESIANMAKYGGGIYNSGTLMLSHSVCNYNAAEVAGGGIHNGSTATLLNSELVANSARDGGGINVYSGSAAFINSEIRANVAISSGGGLEQQGGQTFIVSSRFLDNAAGDTGGAVQQLGGSVYIDRSCLVNNTYVALARGDDSLSTVTTATYNWWGAVDGPSGAGPGLGDSVSSGVIFDPFLTNPILGCPMRANVALYLPRVGP